MKRLNRETVFIILILLIALAIRLWGIDAGLPYLTPLKELGF